eukprot:jgi/Botrbrau1/9043/Bobra.0376s0020.2
MEVNVDALLDDLLSSDDEETTDFIEDPFSKHIAPAKFPSEGGSGVDGDGGEDGLPATLADPPPASHSKHHTEGILDSQILEQEQQHRAAGSAPSGEGRDGLSGIPPGPQGPPPAGTEPGTIQGSVATERSPGTPCPPAHIVAAPSPSAVSPSFLDPGPVSAVATGEGAGRTARPGGAGDFGRTEGRREPQGEPPARELGAPAGIPAGPQGTGQHAADQRLPHRVPPEPAETAKGGVPGGELAPGGPGDPLRPDAGGWSPDAGTPFLGQEEVEDLDPGAIGSVERASSPASESDGEERQEPSESRPSSSSGARTPGSEEGSGGGSASSSGSPHLQLLQRAEAAERALLLTGLESGRDAGPPLDSVMSTLGRAAQTWPPDGAADGHGGILGAHTLVRCDAVPLLSEMVAPSTANGVPTAVSSFHSALAVGTSGGAVFVYMPRGLASDGTASGQPRVIQVGEGGSRDTEAVTCLAFSPMGNLLMVGHANGDVALWELKKQGWEIAKTIKDAHVTAVIQCAFLEGQAGGALTADSRGRLVHHNIHAYLSLTAMLAGRLTKGSQMSLLLDGRQLGPLTKVAGLFAPMRPPVPPKGAAESADTARHFFFQEGGAAWLEGTALICSHKGAFVARVGMDGRLGILHNIPRPPDIRPDCVPYAAWRLRTSTALAGSPPTSRIPSASLIVAWETRLVLLEVPLARPAPPPAAEGGPPPPPQPTPPPTVTRMWEAEAQVVGVAWLEGPSLALLCEHGPRTILQLYDSSGTVVKERLVVGDSLLPQSYVLNSSEVPEACYHNSVAASPDRILLLASQGLKLARMLSWQERVASLRDVGHWEAALLSAFSILRNAGPSPSPLPSDPGAVVWKGEGRGADPRAVADVIISVLLAYLEASLLPGTASALQAGAAADVAIDACLGLGKPEALWEEVAPRFFAAGEGPALLERLLPRVVSGQLRKLAPEVMQALVEHCAAGGRAADVERCVLHLDLASLDFNQVVRLCGEHHLHSALAFLFTRALKEYTAPAARLLSAVLGAGPKLAERAPLAYKLLVYLRCCFQGFSFPPGSGKLDEEERERVRAEMLAFLLHSTRQSLLDALQPFGGDGQDTISKWLPAGAHPVLRILTSIDAGAALAVVEEAVQGWDALDCELREAAGLPPLQESLGLRTAGQAVLDAVLDLLQDPQELGDETDRAVQFVAAHLAEGRATAPRQVVLRVLRHVALGPWREGGGPPRLQREDQFMAIMKQSAVVPGGPGDPGDREWDAELRQLARQAGFARAEAHALHMAGAFAGALECLLREGPPAPAAFRYVDRVLDDPSEAGGKLGEFKEAVLGSMQRLTGADPGAAAALVIRHFPHDHSRVLTTLQRSPELQYGYLKGAMHAARLMEASLVEEGAPRDAHAAPLQASPYAPLLSDPQVGELYLKLLCRFKAAEALPFLQSHDNYRVEEVLSFTQQYKVRDAEAYLLERLGDISAALAIHVSHVEAMAERLLSDVLEGTLPLAALAIFRGGARSFPGSTAGTLGAVSASLGPPQKLAGTPAQGAGPLPPQLAALQGAVGGAVALCQRHSRDAPLLTVQQLWFSILECFVHLLRQLRQRTGTARGTTAHIVEGSASGGGSSTDGKFAELQRVLTGLMEGVISHMAGFVPLKAIGERIISEFAAEQFGDFKGTLLGLLSAYSYEFATLESAKRLLGSDAYRTLYSMYRARSHPLTQASLVGSTSSRSTSEEEAGPSSREERRMPSSSSASRPMSSEEAAVPRMEVFDALNSGRFGSGKLGGPNPGRRERGARLRNVGEGRVPQRGGNTMTEPPSPIHRGGVDLNFLRSHLIM